MTSTNFGNKMIENRRKADNAYKQMDMMVSQERRIMQLANFEIQTSKRIEHRVKNDRFKQKHQEYEESLNQKRSKLADLYKYEMEQWKLEALSTVETQEDRKARIMERAYALRDAREKERKAIVKQKYDQQWREACDDARTLDSKAMTLHMNEQRLAQIKEKLSRKGELSQEENKFYEEWNRQLEALEKRDKEKQEYRRRIDRETAAEVRAQIMHNEEMRQQYFDKQQDEEEAELARLRQEIETEEALRKKRQEEAYERGREILRFNAENRRFKDEEAYIEREHDAILLDYALRKENEENAAEEAKRNANRQAAVQYRSYLEEQMVKEAEDTRYVDEIRKREEEKLWKQRDDALQARQDARDYLMRMVDDGRQEQIRIKQQRQEQEKIEDHRYAQKFIKDSNYALQREREEAEARKVKAMQGKDLLQEQIDYRKYKEQMAQQEAYLEEKQMQHMERLHRQRLAEQGGTVRTFRPLQKNNWYS